jgi:hypothetical protein
VIARTQRLIDVAEAAERVLALGDLFCVELGRRFRATRLPLESTEDETRRAVARRVGEDGGYGVADSILDVDRRPNRIKARPSDS